MSPLTNVVRNPSAEGATASLVMDAATTVSMVSDGTTGAGSRSYALAHGGSGVGHAGARLRDAERPVVGIGERWWARARCRLDPTVLGARKVSAKLVFRDSAGALIGHKQATVGPVGGVAHRWLAMPHNSASERVENGVSRVNLFPDPLVAGNADQWGTYYDPARTFETVTGPNGETVRAYVTTTVSTSAANVPQGLAVVIDTASTPGSTVSAFVDARGPAGSTVIVGGRASGGESMSQYTHTFSGGWDRVGVRYDVTADVGRTAVGLQVLKQRPAGYASERFEFRRMCLEVNAPPGAGAQHFDGSTLNTGAGYNDQASADIVPSGVFHRWTGATAASTSERYDGLGRRVNLDPDPAPASANSWGGDGSAAGANITKSIVSAPDMPAGSAFRATWNVNTTSGFNISQGVSLSPAAGTTMTASMYVRASFPGFIARLVVIAFNAAGNGLGAFYPPQNSTIGATPVRLVTTFVVPTGTSRLQLFYDWGGGSYPQSGNYVELSSALLEYGSTAGAWFSGASASSGTGNSQQIVELIVAGDAPAGAASADLLVYRDPLYQAAAIDKEMVDSLALVRYDRAAPPPFGDGSAAGWYWNGGANASTSSYGRGAPLAVADPETWSVGLRFDSLFPATQTMTVTAITPDDTYPVRSADRAYAVGGFVGTDHEAPPGVDVTYRGQMFAADGTDLGYTDASVVRYDIDPSRVILSDPLEPGNAVLVEARNAFGETKVRRRSGNTFRAGGRTIGLYAPLGLLENVKLPVQTQTLEDADMLERVLSAMPVLVRSMPPVRLPRQLYVAIDTDESQDVDVQYGGEWTRYPLEGTQVSRSVTDIVVPIVTWQTYMDAFPTWAAFNAAYATWLDAMDNPPEV